MAGTDHPDDPVLRNRDVNIHGVLLFGFWLAVCAIAVQLIVWGLFRMLQKEERSHDRPLSPMVESSLQRTPPEPRLEPNPLAPRLRVQAQENAILTSYAWVDRKTSVVRIPIDRAMDILVERGLPPAKPMTAPPAAPPQAPGGTR